MDKTERQRIAASINALRPDWPIASLETFLDVNLSMRAYRDVAVALTFVACDPSTRTPKRVLEQGPWWTVSSPSSSGPPLPPPMCRRCRSPHPADTGCDPDDLARQDTGATERRAQLIAEVKAAAGADCRRCADPRSRCVAHQPVRTHVEAPQSGVQPEAVPVGHPA